ncbi:MAG: energy transducer TonB [Candidatus Margulisbacteria bacterium]|nr:energy transducer TonB [Candidatus Margulisiibacteriota bacterium]
MIQAKAVSVKNIAIYLTLSVILAAGYMVSRPHQIVSATAPVFMGEEIMVQPAAKAAPIAARSVALEPTVVKVVPAPQSNILPLPIVPPSIAASILPVYPAQALASGTEGLVLLSVYVGLTGQPERIETKSSSGNAGLDESAAKAVSQWRFLPATQGGAAIASRFEVPVRFVIK